MPYSGRRSDSALQNPRTIAGFPLWAITSTVGVLVVGAVIAVYLACTAEDIPLDEADGEGAAR